MMSSWLTPLGCLLALCALIALVICSVAKHRVMAMKEHFESMNDISEEAGRAAAICLKDGDCATALGAPMSGAASPLSMEEAEAVLWRALEASVADIRRKTGGDDALLEGLKARTLALKDACDAVGGASADPSCEVVSYLRSPAGASELPAGVATPSSPSDGQVTPAQDEVDAIVFDDENGVAAMHSLVVAAALGNEEQPRVASLSFNSRGGGKESRWRVIEDQNDEEGHSLFRKEGTAARVDPKRELRGFEVAGGVGGALRIVANVHSIDRSQGGTDQLVLRVHPSLVWSIEAPDHDVLVAKDAKNRRVRFYSIMDDRRIAVPRINEAGTIETSVEDLPSRGADPEAFVLHLPSDTYPWFVLFAL